MYMCVGIYMYIYIYIHIYRERYIHVLCILCIHTRYNNHNDNQTKHDNNAPLGHRLASAFLCIYLVEASSRRDLVTWALCGPCGFLDPLDFCMCHLVKYVQYSLSLQHRRIVQRPPLDCLASASLRRPPCINTAYIHIYNNSIYIYYGLIVYYRQ